MLKSLVRYTALVATFSLFTMQANAQALSDLSNTDASNGLKEALTQGIGKAIGNLGTADGFFKNPAVKIPLPDYLKKAEKGMRIFGMGKQADELVLKMNRAAEAAVPEAKTLLLSALKHMSVTDAKDILTGADDAATQYFKRTTAAEMGTRFLPVVTKATENIALAKQYNKFAEMSGKFGLAKKENANLEQYVTQKTLDGVYLMIAQEEKSIRKDPLGQDSSLIKKVFGALGN